MTDKKVNKRRLNRGVSIPMPEGPYSSLQVGGLHPSPASGPEVLVLVQGVWLRLAFLVLCQRDVVE